MSRTRIAVLSDVHGNVPALEAVVEDVAAQGVDEVLVGGDLVGRGPEGSRVARRIRELGWSAIGGNHEDYLLSFRRGEVPGEWRFTEEWAAARWMAAELEPEDVRYLGSLPFSLARPGLRLVHGSPRSNRQGIGPWTGDGELAELLGEIEEPVLVCAHTHRPLVRHAGGRTAINVGSVGLPFNRDRRAQYAILTRSGEEGWEVEMRRVEYDLEEIFDIYRRSGFLAAGGVTARLLYLELEHATPLLVPFIEWARSHGVSAVSEQIEPFLRRHPPEKGERRGRPK